MTAVKCGVVARILVFNMLGVAFLIIAGYLLLHNSSAVSDAGAGVAFFTAAFCVLIGNLQNFESFKASGSGFEAKMREVQAVLEDAKATVASLHELATMTGVFLVDNIAGSGRFGGQGTLQQKDEAKARLLERLAAIGLKETALAEVALADRHWVCVDYVNGIFTLPANEPGWSKLSAEDSLAFRELTGLPEPASPEKCELMLKRLGVNDSFTTELLEDYRHYLQTGEHRRPSVWRDRASWRFRPEVKQGGVYL